MSGYKVFVGNVPFNCTSIDFERCFKGMIGYQTGEVIKRYNQTLGFGYVVFDTKENGTKLMDGRDIIIKNRKLRFSEFNFGNDESLRWSNENNIQNETDVERNNRDIPFPIQKNNFLFIRNVEKDLTEKELRSIFEKYGEMETCHINIDNTTKKSKGTAVIKYKDDKIYNDIIGDQIKIDDYEFIELKYLSNERYKKHINCYIYAKDKPIEKAYTKYYKNRYNRKHNQNDRHRQNYINKNEVYYNSEY